VPLSAHRRLPTGRDSAFFAERAFCFAFSAFTSSFHSLVGGVGGRVEIVRQAALVSALQALGQRLAQLVANGPLQLGVELALQGAATSVVAQLQAPLLCAVVIQPGTKPE
jgi:hypothetical protein